MGFEYFQAVRFSGASTCTNAGKSMTKIPIALDAVVLGYGQVQHDQLVTLARVLERAPVRSFDAHGWRWTVQTTRPTFGSGPHMNVLRPIDLLNY
tara:strand:+ start:331 stop:615 length:285 start_codon:yes stop_codon:yes gene_type:complete